MAHLPGGSKVSQTSYCGHDGAREIHLYMRYAEANALRLRHAEALVFADIHVSRLYAIDGGWAWTACRECRTLEHTPP